MGEKGEGRRRRKCGKGRERPRRHPPHHLLGLRQVAPVVAEVRQACNGA